jgi:hypothetical protein
LDSGKDIAAGETMDVEWISPLATVRLAVGVWLLEALMTVQYR